MICHKAVAKALAAVGEGSLQIVDVLRGGMQRSLSGDLGFHCQAGVEKFGTRAEIKNLNSFKGVKDALEYEFKRQIELVESGGRVVQNNFNDYPVLSNRDMPDVAIHFVKATDDPIMGAAEEILPYVAPAVCRCAQRATLRPMRR